jgi:Ni/Fe-hydrogenase 1 B-type cytochrome subunit
VHVWVGYAFAVNLLWRLVWAFIGGPHARWRAMLPGARGYLREVRDYIADLSGGRPRQYLGHNPLGRIAIAVLLSLLVLQATGGLVLAGTDIFYPPLGGWIAGWIAAPGIDPATLVPYAPDTYDPAAYEAMRAFREPFITMHYYGFFVLLAMASVHVAAVIATEIRVGGNLISAMFSGTKVLSEAPADSAPED